MRTVTTKPCFAKVRNQRACIAYPLLFIIFNPQSKKMETRRNRSSITVDGFYVLSVRYDHIILQANASSLAFHLSILHCFQSPKYYSFSTGELRQENLCSFEARQVYIENLVSKTNKTNKRCRKLPETHWQGCSLPRHCLSQTAQEDHPSKHLKDLCLF